jgi:hypothetical protein
MSRSSWIPLLAVVPALIVLAFLGGRLLYYGGAGAYVPPEVELKPADLTVAQSAPRSDPVDNPAESKGVVIIDYGHDNALFVEELNVLLSKAVARGFSYEIVTPEMAEEEGQRLIDRLDYAKSAILPLPRVDYSAAEITALRAFVERGGRLLIIGDPTRTVFVEPLNSIAGEFGIIYANDYLYSLENNDNNYRNVIYTNFSNSPITEGLGSHDRLIFYSSGSLSAPGHEVIMGDDTVFSSTSEGGRTRAAAALTADDQVLAVGDLTFFTEPYSASESNGILINNIANFLTGGATDFEIRNFPYFLADQVDVVFDDSLVFNSQFENSVKLKQYLETARRQVTFTDEIGDEHDVIYIGRFEQPAAVEDYLDEAGIVLLEPVDEAEAEKTTENGVVLPVSEAAEEGLEVERFVEGRIQIEGVGQLEQGGATLFYLHQENDRNVMIILSSNSDTNTDAFNLLLDGSYKDCSVTPNIAVCQTKDPEDRLPPSLRSDRIDKILVVSDNDARKREDAATGAAEFVAAFGENYDVIEWETATDGSPDLLELQEYDAIVWATGDYWDDSIGEAEAKTLTEYIKFGGNLLISGASVAFDWDHTDFLKTIVHADYLTAAEQADLEVALADHPLARDFPTTAVPFDDTPSGEPLEIDVVNYTPDSRVILKRGPDSKQPGAPSVIAYEDDRAKVAYYAFPIYLVPEGPRNLLIANTLNWFTRKPLELPDEDDYVPYELSEAPSKTEPGPEGTGEPTSEPTGEPTGEPTPEPTGEPTSEPTAEPTAEPTGEPDNGD